MFCACIYALHPPHVCMCKCSLVRRADYNRKSYFGASKYEEIRAPHVEEFCYVTDGTYCKDEILQMESAVLNYLKFEMTVPTANFFLRYCITLLFSYNVQSMQFECLANYIAELSLLEYTKLHYAPSLIAASAAFLAKFILSPSKKPWDPILGHYTLYQPSDLGDCVKALHHLCRNGRANLPAIREKYSQHKVSRFSIFLEQDVYYSATIGLSFQ
ncbi:hypothetical protein CRYUN_Cryun30bG0074100 [Craigia yunnanensis]